VLAVTFDLSTSIALSPLLASDGLPDTVNVSNQPNIHQSEMTLDVNPVNPLNVAGFSHRVGTASVDVFYSVDGGEAWQTTNISQSNDGLGTGNRFDPSIAFDANGNLYVAYIHDNGSTDTLVVAKSTNGGASFTQFSSAVSVSASVGLDKPHIATGLDPFSGNEAVYAVYTQLSGFPIMAAGSNNGGASFSQPVQVSDSGLGFFADPAVGANGELYVSWHNVGTGEIFIDTDLDGLFVAADTFGTDILVKNVEISLGRTPVPAAPDRGIHTGPVLDVDRSGGGYDGRLYLTWVDAVSASDFNSTKNADIFLAWSDNHGASWTLPGSTGNVEHSTGTEFLPWVDVDQETGSVNVLYYTTDGDQATDNDDVNVRLATSVDGGLTFKTATVSRHTSNERVPQGYTGDYLEYIGLAVHGGTAHALWASRIPGGGQGGTDLEALYASASVHSTSGDNVLYISGDDDGATNDTIELKRSTTNPAYVEVRVNNVLQFAALAASVNVIDLSALAGNDTILIDADIDANFVVRGGAGTDGVTLRGKEASLLGHFEFQGEADNDTLTVNFVNGDPLPRPGFNFNFIDGAGQDDVFAVDSEGTHPSYFVNTLTDAADLSPGGRADSSSATDDQITLRAAVQEANFASNKNYIFLPAGANLLSVTGTGGDLQGDLDITKNVVIVGAGAGATIIDASGFGTTHRDRVFDVSGGGTLSLSRLTLTGGHTRTASGKHGGGIQVGNSGTLILDQSAIVDNLTETGGHGGGIYFAASGAGTITRSVITTDHADGTSGGIYLDGSAPGAGGVVSVTSTIIVNNTDGDGSDLDVFASGNRQITSGGNNRFGNETTGLVHNPTGNGDYMGTADYVVTSVVDSYDGSSDPIFMSLRDAVHQANNTADVQEIWLPAWNFVLTRERVTAWGSSEMNVSEGDLEITDSLVIRGVASSTSVAWRGGAAVDKLFELIGDFNGDNIVSNADDLAWDVYDGLILPNLPADADDDGDVDEDDLEYVEQNFGEELELLFII
jgi:hypothetical protein